jgi:NADH:ubiquinone oxidoreductase subunit E
MQRIDKRSGGREVHLMIKSYQKHFARRQTLEKLLKVHECYEFNPECTIRTAHENTDISLAYVYQYSKLRSRICTESAHGVITAKDIVEYVYGEDASKVAEIKDIH